MSALVLRFLSSRICWATILIASPVLMPSAISFEFSLRRLAVQRELMWVDHQT